MVEHIRASQYTGPTRAEAHRQQVERVRESLGAEEGSMAKKRAETWTSRDVQFVPFPRTPDDVWEAFFDGLADHYWSPWRRRLLGDLTIGAHEGMIQVGGWPWWVPAWWARRSVASLAATYAVGGGAVFVVERAVLP